MERVRLLIIGPNSFIAKFFMQQLKNKFYTTLSVRGDVWKNFDYSSYDVIIYFAAIVHHPEITDEVLYNKVNAEIPYEMAKLAVEQGVKKFIYISTMAVVGLAPRFGNINLINRSTPLYPNTPYGRSKLRGERMLSQIDRLCIQLVRLPNVYGQNCPGTFFHRIEQLSRLKILPIYKNDYKFSLISVENVAVALNRLLLINESGVFCPQDTPILSIVERIKKLAEANGIRQKQIKWMWPIVYLANKILPKKFTDNLYGGYYIDPIEYPVLTD